MGTYGANGRHARRPGAHPIPGAVMGGAMWVGRGMPPPGKRSWTCRVAEATRWIMKSNWGPDQNTSAAVATGIVLGLRARDITRKGQRVSVSMLNANEWTNAMSITTTPTGLPLQFPIQKSRPPCPVPSLPLPARLGIPRTPLPGRVGSILPRGGAAGPAGRSPLCDQGSTRAKTTTLCLEIARIFAVRDADEWEDLLLKADVGCVRADEATEGEFYLDHPHAKANGLSVEVDHPVVGKHLRLAD